MSALLATTLMAMLCQGCAGTRDVSSKDPYSHFMGRKYVLKQGCYIYQTHEMGDSLFVGNASTAHFLPQEVSPLFIGRQLNSDVIIVGLLPAGTRFTIVRCEEERGPEDPSRHFKAAFGNMPAHKRMLDVSDLTDLSKNPPEFRQTLAVPAGN